jgi:flagellar basal-body rod protein FlgF
MDRMLYVAMSGAKQAMEQHASVANNMANISTTGFRAQINSFEAVPVVGEESPTRTFVVTTTPRADFRPGPLQDTGRTLDVAVRGEGWLVVQTDAGEAYTRAGNLQVGPEGEVTTLGGRPVLGDAGPLVVPPGSSLTIAANGLVTARVAGNPAVGMTEVGRIKLVNPAPGELVRGEDGLFRMGEGLPPADTDSAVTLASGFLEGSNVNAVEAMVEMIATSRLLEMQMKSIQTANDNAQIANKLLALE